MTWYVDILGRICLVLTRQAESFHLCVDNHQRPDLRAIFGMYRFVQSNDTVGSSQPSSHFFCGV